MVMIHCRQFSIPMDYGVDYDDDDQGSNFHRKITPIERGCLRVMDR